MLAFASLAALIVVGFLSWNLYQRFGVDRIAALNDKRRATSLLVGRGELVDGNRHLDVALSVTRDTFFYENGDTQGSLDLQWIREIEYDSELSTGTLPPNGKVLRLRSNSQTFEFVIPNDVIGKWHLIMPPRGAKTKDAASLPNSLQPLAASSS